MVLLDQRVPDELMDDCEEKHREVLANSGRKATNLYRRVSVVSHQSNDVCSKRRRIGDANNACVVCTVTLVKSSKDPAKSGVRLKCPCNARVCITCFDKSIWYASEPHYSTCQIIRNFTCHVCAVFNRESVRRCCVWLCVDCFERADDRCSLCKRPVIDHNCEKRELWSAHKQQPIAEEGAGGYAYNTPEDGDRYAAELRRRALEKVARARHITNEDIGLLFGDSTQRPCTSCTAKAVRDSLCVKCTPVAAILELLGKNPRPLIASLGERIIPSRALARHVYDRAALTAILNDPDVPFCVNGVYCKGTLVTVGDGTNNQAAATQRPLRSLVSTSIYGNFVYDRRSTQHQPARHGGGFAPSACIVCILFNQSATIGRMLNPDKLYTEPEPREAVYYFNLKLAPDVGVPEIRVDDQHEFTINFQGSVGSYKPTFYYSWRDMLQCLRVERDGRIVILPRVP